VIGAAPVAQWRARLVDRIVSIVESGAQTTMSAESDPGHGNSYAAWIAVTIMIVAFAIGTVGYWLDLSWLVWASVGLVGVGAVSGYLLAKAGYGVGGDKLTRKTHI